LDKGVVLSEKWEILEYIATGGMAEVYRARQMKLDRDVAVKVLSQRFLDSFEGDEQEIQIALERFHREVKAMAQVRHTNVLQIYDHDRAVLKRNGGELSIEYIAMEYIPGQSLRATLPPEGMQTDEKEIGNWIRTYFLPILDGLETVHHMGIVHRDIKPENVLLDGHTPKIADFGLASGKRWKSVTQSHHVAGTAPYQAYEQFIDMGETDVRADIYSLGKMLYEVVTGKMDKKPALFWKTARLLNPETPFLKRLDRIIQQATDEDKSQRTPSVKLFRQSIVDLLEGEEESMAKLRWSFLKGFGTRKAVLLMAVLIIVAVASISFNLLYHRQKTPLPTPSSAPSFPEFTQGQGYELPESQAVQLSSPASPLSVKDGATLHLVPQGEVILPENFGPQSGKSVQVNPFYMDETEVTNHQYVEFLNGVLERIQVEGEVVKGDGDVWLLLGEATKGYEPIVFKEGTFSVKRPAFHSLAVVRVTAYGAAAYARFYGRRLPSEVEWLRVMGGAQEKSPGPSSVSPDVTMGMDKMHREMFTSSSDQRSSSRIPAAVIQSEANVYKIRGLAENVNEWGTSIQSGSSRNVEEPQYVILPFMTPRHPWEAFGRVGFRTALSIPMQEK
jgi:serine/threonine-protein kinase